MSVRFNNVLVSVTFSRISGISRKLFIIILARYLQVIIRFEAFMDLSVLSKISEITTIKKEKIIYEYTMKGEEISLFKDSIQKLLNSHRAFQEYMEFDYSLKWYDDYTLKLLETINNDIHNYAEKKCELKKIGERLLRESQIEKALNKLIEIKKGEIELINKKKEEEDAEELFIAKQYL